MHLSNSRKTAKEERCHSKVSLWGFFCKTNNFTSCLFLWKPQTKVSVLFLLVRHMAESLLLQKKRLLMNPEKGWHYFCFCNTFDLKRLSVCVGSNHKMKRFRSSYISRPFVVQLRLNWLISHVRCTLITSWESLIIPEPFRDCDEFKSRFLIFVLNIAAFAKASLKPLS